MSRKRSEAVLLGWLSANKDCKEKRFIQKGNSLFFSKAYQSLSSGAKYLYDCCCIESGGHRNFKFPLKAAKKYGFAEQSFRRYIKELKEDGFLEIQSGAITRQPNQYSFSFRWKENAHE